MKEIIQLRSKISADAGAFSDTLFNLGRSAMLLFLAILYSSCTLQKSYWVESKNSVGNDALKFAKIPATDSDCQIKYHRNLRVIEYDDSGDRWERMQVLAAVQAIRTARKVPVVVYAHGWRHNAKPNRENNLKDFSDFLLYREEHGQPVIGIYIGWRGASVYEEGALAPFVAPAMAVSLLDRIPAADRINSIPLVDDLWTLRKYANLSESPLVLVGHSLGGRIIERAVSQSIVAYNSQRANYGDISSAEPKPADRNVDSNERREALIADLTILINPASESLYARRFKMALRNWPTNEPPAVISITSESDTAMKNLWPIGRTANRVLDPFAALPSREFRLGHHEDPDSNLAESQESYLNKSAGFDERQLAAVADFGPNEEYLFSNVDMMRHGLSNHGYLVLRCRDSILAGHGGDPEKGGVFSKEMNGFVSCLARDTVFSRNYPKSPLFRALHAR